MKSKPDIYRMNFRSIAGTSLLSMWQNKIQALHSSRHPEFDGRIESAGNHAELYQFMKDRSEKLAHCLMNTFTFSIIKVNVCWTFTFTVMKVNFGWISIHFQYDETYIYFHHDESECCTYIHFHYHDTQHDFIRFATLSTDDF